MRFEYLRAAAVYAGHPREAAPAAAPDRGSQGRSGRPSLRGAARHSPAKPQGDARDQTVRQLSPAVRGRRSWRPCDQPRPLPHPRARLHLSRHPGGWVRRESHDIAQAVKHGVSSGNPRVGITVGVPDGVKALRARERGGRAATVAVREKRTAAVQRLPVAVREIGPARDLASPQACASVRPGQARRPPLTMTSSARRRMSMCPLVDLRARSLLPAGAVVNCATTND